MTEPIAKEIAPASPKRRIPPGPRSRGPRSFAVEIKTGLAPNEKEILNLDEAAAFLGVSLKTFLRTLRMENLPGRKVGRDWKFSRAALVTWVASGKTQEFLREREERAEGPTHGAGRSAVPRRRRREDFRAEED